MRLLPHPRAWLAKSCVAVLALLAGASAHAADTGAVCVYADVNYGGAHTCVDADTPWIGSAWNDRASSVRLRAGVQARLFNDINYGGRALALAGDTPNLVSLGFNDLMSSLKVAVACKATDWS
ncbi:MAG: peptidase inhibitor family I36 protein, partial [Burkholderiales bacterium]|nr:peptidase inhibitor family I36 protein [Burkholderiales bacterium]